MPPRITILLPSGWCVRNFVRTDFLSVLSRESQVTLVSPLADDPQLRAEMGALGVSLEEFPLSVEGRLEPFISEFNKYCYFRRRPSNLARFHFVRTPADGRPLRDKIYRGLLVRGSGVGRLVPPGALGALERAVWRSRRGLERERRLLERLSPDLLVSTMPLSHRLERPLLWAAAELGVRRACVIQSWDNITTKGMFPVDFDLYMVWSEFMRAETLREYPEIEPARVLACGAPQFDFYRRPGLVLPREEFFRRIGADPSRPLIVWTGVAPQIMPGEPNAIALLCEELRKGAVRGNPQMLLRPHPIGGGARFAAVRERYPEMLFTETNDSDPQRLLRWSPSLDDVVMLASTMAHADVNINMFSTTTLDSCIFDRPVVNVAFDEEVPAESSERLRRFYTFEYYRVVLESGSVRVAETIGDMVASLNLYLENPALDAEGRARLVEVQCGRVDGRSAARTAAAVLDAAMGRSFSSLREGVALYG